MANDVIITFTADVSELQNGMQQATRAVQATSTALRGGADQINATFSSLSQAYANTAAQRISAAQTSSDAVLTMARQNEQAQSNIALNGVREQSSLSEGRAQMSELARQEELTGLLALEAQREAIERQHLQFLESTSQERTAAYAASQRNIDELTRQSVLNRLNIERDGTNEIYKSYLRTFEQAGNAVASSLMGMITGQMRLRDAARNILVQILQSFVQARVRMVADWLASVATQIAATQSGEMAKTSAVAAGTAARTGLEASASNAFMANTAGAVLKSIMASAGETFAGVFGFLAPVMGPAAAGPAAGAQAAVLSVGTGLASFAAGAWDLPKDMIAQVHEGEMIIPSRPAAQFRDMMSQGVATTQSVHVHHATNFHVTALDSRSVQQFFADHGRTIMRTINESVRTGAHVGLSKFAS
jgi:hypothetical protein